MLIIEESRRTSPSLCEYVSAIKYKEKINYEKNVPSTNEKTNYEKI